jgi:putative ABC transport system permease protein
MSHLAQDLRYGARTLLRRRSLTAIALATLALGIGANTAMFSVVNAVLLTPPPFREPDRLVMVWASNPELAASLGFEDKLPTSPAAFYDWKSGTRSFEALAMMRPGTLNLSGGGDPERLGVVNVTGEFFPALGVPAALGRTLTPADDDLAAPAAIVLSHAFWQRRFGGDPGVVGQAIRLDGRPRTVVGVMPKDFTFPRGGQMPHGFGFRLGPDAWVPAALPPPLKAHRGMRGALAFGRLGPGVSLGQAQADLHAITQRLWEAHPDSDRGWGVRVAPLGEQLTGNVRPALLVLFGAVGLVLLIACGNVASLLTAQAVSRRKEIAVRGALGASRGRLVRQLITESTLLSVTGGLLGLVCAYAAVRALVGLIPPTVATLGAISIDARVAGFTVAVSLLTGLVFGLLPARHAARVTLGETLKDTARGAGDARGRRAGRVLVAAEMALAVVLVIGAGLLLRSFARLVRVDAGFRAEGLVTFRLDLPSSRYAGAARSAFVEAVLERLRALPGVGAAGATTALPMSGSENLEPLEVEGRPRPPAGQEFFVDFRVVTPGYFAALGIPLKAGRVFESTDGAQQPRVAVVSEALARAQWPGQDPVGRRLRAYDEEDWATVVGVVGDVRHSGLHADLRPHLYTPNAHSPRAELAIAVRTSTDPRALLGAIRGAVAAVDPDQPIADLRTMDDVIAVSLAGRRFNMLLLGAFAGLALVLSAVGLYGVMSYSVGQRLREMGVRQALGATRADVLRLVFGEALRTVVIGLVPGVLAALALGRLVSSLLYGIPAADPITFAAAAGTLTAVALLASLVPGLRATRVDPMITLRAE